jgi:flavin-dependent dehydrogenase
MSPVSYDDFDKLVDVLVIGTGAGGMASALAANAAGLDTLVIEKTEYFGGSTARSGGGAWVPNAPALTRKGQNDDPAQILTYLETIAGDKVSRERLKRYVDESPGMMEFLESQPASSGSRATPTITPTGVAIRWDAASGRSRSIAGCSAPTRSACAPG